MDPPPSVAWAMGTSPAATAAALPPLDPPGEYAVFHGLQVGPVASDSVVATKPSSGVAVRPTMISPAVRYRPTSQESLGRCSQRLEALLRRCAWGRPHWVTTGLSGQRARRRRSWSGRPSPGRLPPFGLFKPTMDHRVQLSVNSFDSLDGRVDEIASAHFTRSHELGLSCGVEGRQRCFQTYVNCPGWRPIPGAPAKA